MQYSYNWLKKYVPDLPSPEKLEEGIIFHAFEVEGIEKKGDDTLLEIKVLPDRAHDCLCHEGVARECSAIFNLPFSLPQTSSDMALGKFQDLSIKIEDNKACRRYVGARVKDIKVGPSPEWLAGALESLGQRSINNIVDATNHVMFDIGQPMHAFDADKLEGDITVRFARAGETMTTLDNKNLVLDESILVIADDKGPLALAGIKGGNRAEVDANTKNLILESANFDPVLIRKTSAKVGVRTDASKAFENNLSSETALLAMIRLVDLLQDIAGGEYCGVVDVYPSPQDKKQIKITTEYVNSRLGIEIDASEIKNILERLGIVVEIAGEELKLTIPHWRVDLEEEANVVEEVGRIFGYEKIAPKLLERAGRGESSSESEVSPRGARAISQAEKKFALKNKLREILAQEGFAEVMGYALTDKGEVKLANPLASDKGFLRTNLSDWLSEKITFNLNYVLFDTEPIKIFEIGKVFKEGFTEQTNIVIGIGYRKKVKGQSAKEQLEKIIEKFGAKGQDMGDEVCSSVEIDLDELSDQTTEIEPADLSVFMSPAFNYRPISNYPRIVRDVAVWVPEATSSEEVGDLIKKSVNELCVLGPILFDEFAKEGRKSLAFRLIFQSYDRTLSDDEANSELNKVIEALESKSYEVRK
jgi:phenylalanyl-tRNA synthetase beta chain